MNAPRPFRAASLLRGLAAKALLAGCACSATALAQRIFSPDAASGMLARPKLGAFSSRGMADELLGRRLRIPGVLSSLAIPESFSVILWVRIEPGKPPGQLFGFGDPKADYLMLATDSSGAPVLSFFNREQIHKMSRAEAGAANLADSKLHSVVAVVNLGTGLVRLYVDGSAESATTLGTWRPRDLGSAFASSSLQGKMNAAGNSHTGLLLPRIVGRELTEQEIAALKPVEDEFQQESAVIEPDLAARLAGETLVEFWPKEFSYLFRRRPL